MTNEEEEIADEYDGDDGDLHPFVFSKANKYVQILLVGLFVGCIFIGLSLVGMGIMRMVDPPQPIANGTLDKMMCYDDSYYQSDKRNEMLIYNCEKIDGVTLWIGSPEEYYSWMDMKLLDNKAHWFDARNGIDPKKIQYKFVLKYYDNYDRSSMEDLSNANRMYFVIVSDANKSTASSYEVNLKGNITNPVFTIRNVPFPNDTRNYQTYYHAI